MRENHETGSIRRRLVPVVVLCAFLFLAGCAGRQVRRDDDDLRASVVRTARTQVGTRYCYGGDSPSKGFDCSGFTRWVYKRNGITLPRRASDQMKTGKKVSPKELRPGDLVFFGESGHEPSHVGICSDRGTFIHCPSTGGKVREERLAAPWWQKSWMGAREVLP